MCSCTNMFLFNSGQVCAAPSRVYIQRDIAESFIENLKTRYSQATSSLGASPNDATTFMGPLADGAQYDRVMSYIDSGKKEAELAVGGHRVGDEGYFVAPTIFINPKSDAKVLREEIFGPVLTVVAFDTEVEAIELANDTEYGLAGKNHPTEKLRSPSAKYVLNSICLDRVPSPRFETL